MALRPSAVDECQVRNYDDRSEGCQERESGGLLCELEAGHEHDLFGTGHWISNHTIRHSIAGNGYSCWYADGTLAWQ